jgi:hypothetical protein
MKKILSVLLVLVLGTLLVSCAEDDNNPLKGTWAGVNAVNMGGFPDPDAQYTVVLGDTSFNMTMSKTGDPDTIYYEQAGTYTWTDATMTITRLQERAGGTGDWIPVDPPVVETVDYVRDGNTIEIDTGDPNQGVDGVITLTRQ